MSVHSPHEDIHEHGLADDCPRCAALAERWWDLDDEVLLSLIALANDPLRHSRVRSQAEARAAANVLTVLEWTGRLAQASPLGVQRYLSTNWHVNFE
jgi:hypothetical protein